LNIRTISLRLANYRPVLHIMLAVMQGHSNIRSQQQYTLYTPTDAPAENIQVINQSTSFPPCAVSLTAVGKNRGYRHSTNMSFGTQKGPDFAVVDIGSKVGGRQRLTAHSDKEHDSDTEDLHFWSQLGLLREGGIPDSSIVAADWHWGFAD